MLTGAVRGSRVADDARAGSDVYTVYGWANTTSFVFPLLWKARLDIADTALFDGESRYQFHMFTSRQKKKLKNGSTYVEIKKRNAKNLTYDDLEYRFTRRSIKRSTNLWGVKREEGYRGAVLSETGGNQTLQGIAEIGYGLSEEKTAAVNKVLCLHGYIEPEKNTVYRATLERDRPKFPRREINLRVDVKAAVYSDCYLYPKAYAPENTGGGEGGAAAPPPFRVDEKIDAQLIERIHTASVNVVQHIENSHDIFFTNAVLEFIVDARNPDKLFLTGAKSGKYLIIREMWRWPLGKVALEEALRLNLETPRGSHNGLEGLDAIHRGKHSRNNMRVMHIMKKGQMLEEVGPTDSARAQTPSDEDQSDTSPPYQGRRHVARMPKVQSSNEYSSDAGSPSEYDRSSSPAQSPSPIHYQRRLSPSKRSHKEYPRRKRPQSARHRSGDTTTNEALNLAGGNFNVRRNILRSSRSVPGSLTLQQRPLSSAAREIPAFIPSGSTSKGGGHSGGIDEIAGGGSNAGEKRDNRLKHWRDTRPQEVIASEKAMDNIRVTRAGVDDLHIKLSKNLRIAHEKIRKLELQIENMKAKREADATLLAEAELVCSQVQKRLSKLEDKYAREYKEWTDKNNALATENEYLKSELAKRTDELKMERVVFEETAHERDELKGALTAALRREETYLAKLQVEEEAAVGDGNVLAELKRIKQEQRILIEAHRVLNSEHEEVVDRYKDAVKDLEAREKFREALFTLLADQSTNGVNPPDRKGGGFSSYPVPQKKNVERAVKMLCDGKFRPPPKTVKKGQSKALRQLKYLRAVREKSEKWFEKKTVAVDGTSVFRQLRLALSSGGRTLFGKRIATIGDLFNAIDKDGGGTVSGEELRAGLHRLDIGLTSDQVRSLLVSIDSDNDGDVNYDEFISAAKRYSPVRNRKTKKK